MVSDKIKALLNIKGKKYKELAQFARGSFSADELIRIADFVNCQLAFNIDADQKVILTIEDLRNPVTNTEK